MNSSQRNFIMLAILWLVVNLFLANHNTVLWDEDEAAYASFAKTMVETGDYINPEFLWAEVHRKPPFHFWTIAVSYKIFGVNEWATRLPSVLAFLLSLASLFLLGKRLYGERIAAWSVLILASSLLLPSLSKIAFTDTTLLLFETTAVLALLNFLKTPNWRWSLLFWTAIALGMLVKGPPILILTFGIGGFLILFHSERKRLFRLELWLLFPLAALPLLIWGWFSYQKDGGETINFLLDWYIYKRLSGDGHVFGQTGPPGYHFAILVGSFLPWLAFLLPVFPSLFKQLKAKDGTAITLFAWLVFGWIFYELMSSKLPSYSIGAAPAFAILIAQELVKSQEKNYPYKKVVKTGALIFFILSLFLILGLLGFAFVIGESVGMVRAIVPLTLCWGISIGATVFLYLEKWDVGAKGLTAFGLAITTVAWLTIVPMGEPARSASKRLAHRLTELAANDYTVVLGADRYFNKLPSIPFYISEHFSKYYVEPTLEQAQADYEKNDKLIFVMSDLWAERWEREWKEQGKVLGVKEKIVGWETDKLQSSTYWILRK